MMRPVVLFVAAAITLGSFSACRCSSEPRPLSEDQRREYLEHLEEVRRMEEEEFDLEQP